MNTSIRLIALTSILSITGLALAGECPADKVGKSDLAGAATAPVGVTDTELASVDLCTVPIKHHRDACPQAWRS